MQIPELKNSYGFGFTADSRQILVASSSKSVVLDVSSAKTQILEDFSRLSIAPDRDEIFGRRHGKLTYFDPHSGELHATSVPLSGLMASVAVSPNGRLAVIAYRDGTVGMYRVDDGSHVKTLNAYRLTAHQIHFLSGGTQFVTFGVDSREGVIRLWDSDEASRRPVRSVFTLQRGADTRLAWNQQHGLLWSGLSVLSGHPMPRSSSRVIADGYTNVLFADESTLAFLHSENDSVPVLLVFDVESRGAIRRLESYSSAIRSRIVLDNRGTWRPERRNAGY